jgi:hypothetical protein
MEFDRIRWNLELCICFGNFPTKLPEMKGISFWKSKKVQKHKLMQIPKT